jgi:hypothetical protein
MATRKQQIALQKISENIGNSPTKTLGTILAEAGYSESVCKTPTRVTQSKGWRELLDQYFPDNELLLVHRRMLYKQEVFVHNGKVIPTGQPHSDVKYALDLLYKMKNYYKDTKAITIENEYSKMSDDELLAKIDEYRKSDRYSKFTPKKSRKDSSVK